MSQLTAVLIAGTAMHHPLAPDDVFATHAELIESVLAASGRVHRLPADHAEEFRSWARLLDHDQAILRKFAGRSAFAHTW